MRLTILLATLTIASSASIPIKEKLAAMPARHMVPEMEPEEELPADESTSTPMPMMPPAVESRMLDLDDGLAQSAAMNTKANELLELTTTLPKSPMAAESRMLDLHGHESSAAAVEEEEVMADVLTTMGPPVIVISDSGPTMTTTTLAPPPSDEELTLPLDQVRKSLAVLDSDLIQAVRGSPVPVVPAAGEARPGSYAIDPLGPAPTLDRQQQTTQLQGMIDRLNGMATNLEEVIGESMKQNRYATAAVLNQVLSSVRRVRVSMDKLQNRVMRIQAVTGTGANTVDNAQPNVEGAPQPGIGTQMLQTFWDRLNAISEDINVVLGNIRERFPGRGGAGSSTQATVV